MKRQLVKGLSVLAVLGLALAGCSSGGGGTAGDQSGTPGTAASGKMTDVGTPRDETLIVDILSGQIADPDNMNPYITGSVNVDAGVHQLMWDFLWEINTMEGEQFPDLADGMPEALDDTFTKFRIRIRPGIKWSDGVDFTAQDVEFTANMLLENPELPYSGYFSTLVKSMTAEDDGTLILETVQPEAKIEQKLGVVIFGNGFVVVPKHIWENEDPTTFKNTNPVVTGPYTIKDRDTKAGNWFLYERREDWQNTPVGQVTGEPAPKYVLFKYFGSEEKRTMAAMNGEIDMLMDVSPESLKIMLGQSDNIKAWSEAFPYAAMDDPCQRGLTFQTAKAPFDNVDVRWALALAMDIVKVSNATYDGMMRVSAIQLPPTTVLQDTYHFPMEDWLTNDLVLSDGYKPYDTSYATRMVEQMAASGEEGLPVDDQVAAQELFGVGWFKYDPEEATKLLEKNGFKLEDGKWYLPDGSLWTIIINAPADFEIQSMRLAFAVADAWRQFGINAEVKQMDAASFWRAEGTGEFDVGSYWPSCGLLPDATAQLAGWHNDFETPLGEVAPANQATSRWHDERISELLDELAGMPQDDPQVIEKITEINQIFAQNIPFLPMFGTSKIVPVSTSTWQGFQTDTNPFEGPWWWWSQMKFYLPHYQPASS